MTLEQLRIFVAVAERQHVTRAAAALHLAQSAASAAIAALEAGLDVKLFDRVGRGIVLTEPGRVFLGEARAVLARAEAATLRLSDYSRMLRGTLSVHASQTIAGYWLPRHLVAFRRAWPAVEVALVIGNTAQVAAAVHDGATELGFVEGALDDPALDSAAVAADRLLVVTAPDHPWAGRRRLVAADLLHSDWVLREPGSGTRSAFEAALEGFGLDPGRLAVALELPSNEAVRAAAEAGMGAAAMSATVAAPSLEAGLLSRAAIDLPDRSFRAVWHRGRTLSRAGRALLDLLPSAPATSVRRAAAGGSTPG